MRESEREREREGGAEGECVCEREREIKERYSSRYVTLTSSLRLAQVSLRSLSSLSFRIVTSQLLLNGPLRYSYL